MKVRNGFVSNSSSSSFLVIFPREPKSAEDVKEMVFNKGQTSYVGYYDDDIFSVEEVSETIWNDIKSQKKNDYDVAKNVMRSISSYDYPDAPNYEDYKTPNGTGLGNYDWDAYERASEKYAEKKLKEFFNERKLKLKKINEEDVTEGVFYTFEYSDNDGPYGVALEHGDLFENLKHIKVSNH